MWADPFTIEIDGRLISLRAAEPVDRDLLMDGLDALVVESPTPTINYTVEFGQRHGELHLLRWGGCLVARERTVDELLLSLGRHLGGHGASGDDIVRLRGALVASGQGAVIVPEAYRSFAWRAASRHRGRGARYVSLPHVDVRVETATIEPPHPVTLAVRSASALRERYPSDLAPTAEPRSPWPLRGLVVLGDQPVSRAGAVLSIASVGALLGHADRLGQLLADHPDVGVAVWDGGDVNGLASIFGRLLEPAGLSTSRGP